MDIPNDPLAGDAKGRAEKFVAKPGGWLRPPFCAPEAGREADAYSRAASPRGCTRLRRRPLAGEPRRSLSSKSKEYHFINLIMGAFRWQPLRSYLRK